MAFSKTYDTANPGAAISNREDLSDILTILAPEETPVLSSLAKTRASAVQYEWSLDSLADPVTTGTIEVSEESSYEDHFEKMARIAK